MKKSVNSDIKREVEADYLKEISQLTLIVEPLTNWFQGRARNLPWREETTPYRVWVSEIMLQQTRVEAVIPYFERFISLFPTVYELAEAQEEILLKSWEGLGYYNRVRNLQKAAAIIVNEMNGEIPKDPEVLMSLPGIGSYTAGAIASIAFGIKRPAVDGNVFRVISRLLTYEKDILLNSTRKEVENMVQEILPENPSVLNQALMELGALVCIPNGQPKCAECPLKFSCKAGREDSWMEFPVKNKKGSRKIENRTVLILKDQQKTALHKRESKGLLAGMYELPNVLGHLDEDGIRSLLKNKNIKGLRIRKLEEAKHIFSHVEWHMQGYEILLDELEPVESDLGPLVFAEYEEIKNRYPIPSAFKAYIQYLKKI